MTFQISAGDGASPTLRLVAPETALDQLWTIQHHCDLPEGPYDSGTGSMLIRYQMDVSLQAVPDMVSGNGLVSLSIERAANSHPDAAGYGTAMTAANLQALVEKYGACPAHKAAGGNYPLTVTAISLPNGGLYDVNKNWSSPHNNRRAGEDSDIALNSLPESDQVGLKCLFNAVHNSGMKMPVASESLVLDSASGKVLYGPNMALGHPHIHLWTGEVHQYPLDITSDWHL